MTTQIDITSFITTNGVPATTLPDVGYPKVRIWSINGGLHQLVVGAPDGTGSNQDGVMLPVSQGTSPNIEDDGFWYFVFDSTIGYNLTTQYLVRVDSGPSQSSSERYQSVEIDVEPTNDPTFPAIVANAVWDAQTSAHTQLGSFGLLEQDNQTLIHLLLKYSTCKTKIDTVAKTLTVYDVDCATPLRIFQLYDSTGTPSVDQVTERVPIAGGDDGLPVCPNVP